MNPRDLLETARVLLSSGKGKPTQVSLRRAISSAYYALFHCLARECADLMVGGVGSARSKSAWRQVYRALEHGYARNQCGHKEVLKKFPKEIEDFANAFITMQKNRNDADYDPTMKYAKSVVAAHIASVEVAVISFKKVAAKDRRAFCAFVLLKERKS